MLYFSYGSNMSIRRIGRRIPSVRAVTVAKLPRHQLLFHKVGRDGSAKCDAAETPDTNAHVVGVVFDICASGERALDRAEGLGRGYDIKTVSVESRDGQLIDVATYYATHIDASLKPFHWYKTHVLVGAREHQLPDPYVQFIEGIESISDPDSIRHRSELAIY